ncbi:phosphoglycerate mutase-like protein 1 [Pistacia vera]|uniref:phosphoglycerate mutase-like protein 1 n=1 Tax=Pistacia vera TaxID=55513 RepID=UPI0012638998|nr:phosphoglycerate mutase-like protein 1 [Pistacia vera]
MDASISPLYPSHRCKTIHLVTHGQGMHNVAAKKSLKALLSPKLFDAPISTLGWQQVADLRKHVLASGLLKRIELVITSPKSRSMSSSTGSLGGEGYVDGTDAPHLMVEKAGNSDRSAISSLNCPPLLQLALPRTFGIYPCDKRRSINEYRALFPSFNFALIENDDDILWMADTRETNEHVAKRGMEFINWLWTRKEKEIAVVTHSGFLYHTLSAFGTDCHPSIKDGIRKHFANCELRSMVIVDRSMLGSDSATTNFPGKIPSGLDLPSDVAAEKHQDKLTPN